MSRKKKAEKNTKLVNRKYRINNFKKLFNNLKTNFDDKILSFK